MPTCPCKTTIDHPNSRGDFYDRTGGDAGERGSQPSSLRACEAPRPAGLVEEHSFNRALRDTFQEATDVSDKRASQYGDSWNLDQMHDGLLASTLALPRPAHLHREFLRLCRCAAIIDIKRSRLEGPYKADSLIDLVNYEAAYLQWRAAYELATGTILTPRDDILIWEPPLRPDRD